MSEHVAEAAHHGGSLITQKIGPLPAYAYALVIIAGIWIVYLVKKRQVSPGTPTAVLADTGTASPAENAPSSYTGVVTGENGTPAVNSNAVWARTVANQLVAEGSDPSAVSNAIAKYLAGSQLSQQERALINLALTKFGQPPEGVIPVNAAPTPAPAPAPHAPASAPKPAPVHAPVKAAPKPSPPKKAAQLYTVKSGDSLSSIAQRFYGNFNWQKIYGANRTKVGGNPNLIHPGLVLVIPA